MEKQQFSKLNHHFIDLGIMRLLRTCDLRVFLVLLRRIGYSERTCFPSVKDISRNSGVHYRNVSGALRHLEKCGLIRITRQPGRVNHYHLPEITEDLATHVINVLQVQKVRRHLNTIDHQRDNRGRFTPPQNMDKGHPQNMDGSPELFMVGSHEQNVESKKKHVKREIKEKQFEGERVAPLGRPHCRSKLSGLNDEELVCMVEGMGFAKFIEYLIQSGYDRDEIQERIKNVKDPDFWKKYNEER